MNQGLHPLDIVIAWVDGNDISLKNKRRQFMNQNEPSNALDDTRFASNDEIYFASPQFLSMFHMQARFMS
jgi:hypothetical protein